MEKTKLYSYRGPVTLFGKCIANVWKAETCAVSEGKARNNLTYRFKQENNLGATAPVLLPGKLTEGGC